MEIYLLTRRTKQPRRPTKRQKSTRTNIACFLLFGQIDRLDLRQFDAAFGAAARDDGAATPRAHAGAETEFAGARTFFGLPGAFHSFLFLQYGSSQTHSRGADVFDLFSDFASWKRARSITRQKSFANPLNSLALRFKIKRPVCTPSVPIPSPKVWREARPHFVTFLRCNFEMYRCHT